MSGFICTKPITLTGKKYVPGEEIPAEAILPGRVLALERSGYIAKAFEYDYDVPAAKTSQKSDNGETLINIPISTAEGILPATVSSQSVSTAFHILQLSEKDVAGVINEVDDDDALMLANAVERRKGVLKLIAERHAQLTEAGDADGEDV